MANCVQELASALQSAHPKIQRMCEEESDDAEAVAKLLEINDSIHRTIERYKLMKTGDIEAANKIEKGTLGTTTGVSKNAANELSLIDFDPEPQSAPPAASDSGTNGSLLDADPMSAYTQAKPKTVEDDLLGLSLDEPGAGGLGAISLGPSTGFSAHSSTSFTGTPSAFTSSLSSVPHTSSHASPKPNYDAFASLSSALPSSKPATSVPMMQQQHQQQQRPSSQAPLDPFAALVSASSRPSTPSKQLNTSQGGSHAFSAAQQTPPAQTDDDWAFESALPEPQTINALSGPMAIDFEARRVSEVIQVTAHFSNTTNQKMTGLHFQVAVGKKFKVLPKTQSSRELAPATRHAVQQEIMINGVPIGQGNQVQMRFKVSYEMSGQPHEQQGTFPSLGVS